MRILVTRKWCRLESNSLCSSNVATENATFVVDFPTKPPSIGDLPLQIQPFIDEYRLFSHLNLHLLGMSHFVNPKCTGFARPLPRDLPTGTRDALLQRSVAPRPAWRKRCGSFEFPGIIWRLSTYVYYMYLYIYIYPYGSKYLLRKYDWGMI